MVKRMTAFGWLDFVTGLLLIALGIALLRSPQSVLAGMVTLLGIAAALSGASDIALHTRLRRIGGPKASSTLITGTVSALSGLMLLLYPVIGRWILGIILPIWFIVRCASRIIGYDLMRWASGRVAAAIMLFLNILGLLFGILMVFNAALFTMSLGILVALNLVISGISDVIEAFGSVVDIA